MKIRIGTRGSKLALWQANHVAGLLQEQGIETEIITIDTKGDKIQEVSIAKIGSKGVFTEEIEEQLLQETIDIAVHSAKDMQSELPKAFELIAFTERELVNDVVVSHNPDFRLEEGGAKPVRIGTSSTRRVATLRKYYPQAKPVSVRGNLQTRIRKMEEGVCDALLLAYAGVHRMGYDSLIVMQLSTEQFTPAVGQGSVAIEVTKKLDNKKKEAIRACINHRETEIRLLAERAFLRKLQGGCSVPVYALAKLTGGELEIAGGVIALDGKTRIHISQKGSAGDAESVGTKLAEKVIEAGGAKILKEIKGQQGV